MSCWVVGYYLVEMFFMELKKKLFGKYYKILNGKVKLY